MKAEKKDKITDLPDLKCVKGFTNDFLAPINAINKQMNERKRFVIRGGYHKGKEDSYYIAQLLYDGKPILTEKLPVISASKSDHERIMCQVIYMISLNLITAGTFSIMKASEEAAKLLKSTPDKESN